MNNIKSNIAVVIGGLIILFVFLTFKDGVKNNLEIGAILNLTGGSSFQGENSRNAIELAVGEINEKGGVLGRQVVINYQDNLGDNPKGGLLALQNLIREDIKFFVGPNLTPSAIAMIPEINKADIIAVSPSVGTEKYARESERVFNLYPSNIYESTDLARYLYEDKGFRKIAIFGSKQGWEFEQANIVNDKFIDMGGEVVALELPTMEKKDLKTESLRIKQSDPEAIVFTNYGTVDITSKMLRDLGVEVPFYSVLLFPSQIENAKGALEGTVFVNTDVVNDEFNQKYIKAYSTEPGFPAVQSYDAINFLMEGINNAGSEDVDSVIKELKKIKVYDGVSGSLTFDENGNSKKPIIYNLVVDGKIKKLSK